MEISKVIVLVFLTSSHGKTFGKSPACLIRKSRLKQSFCHHIWYKKMMPIVSLCCFDAWIIGNIYIYIAPFKKLLAAAKILRSVSVLLVFFVCGPKKQPFKAYHLLPPQDGGANFGKPNLCWGSGERGAHTSFFTGLFAKQGKNKVVKEMGVS